MRDSRTTRNDGSMINELVGTELQHEQSADKGSDIEGDDIPVGHCSRARLQTNDFGRGLVRGRHAGQRTLERMKSMSKFKHLLAVRHVQKPGRITQAAAARSPYLDTNFLGQAVHSHFAILSSRSLWFEFEWYIVKHVGVEILYQPNFCRRAHNDIIPIPSYLNIGSSVYKIILSDSFTAFAHSSLICIANCGR